MLRATLTIALAAALVAPAYAGPEVSVSGVQDLERHDRQARFSVGYANDVAFAEAGLRQDDGLDAVAGLRYRFGPVDLRAGVVGVLGHEGTHDFGGDYGEVEDDAAAYGGMLGLSVDTGSAYRPFLRWQRLRVDHDYRETRVVGYTEGGNPIQGDPVTSSEEGNVDEVVLGVRLAF